MHLSELALVLVLELLLEPALVPVLAYEWEVLEQALEQVLGTWSQHTLVGALRKHTINGKFQRINTSERTYRLYC